MNVKFRYFIYIACIICLGFWSFNLKSYAAEQSMTINQYVTGPNDSYSYNVYTYTVNNNARYCIYKKSSANNLQWVYQIYSNSSDTLNVNMYGTGKKTTGETYVDEQNYTRLMNGSTGQIGIYTPSANGPSYSKSQPEEYCTSSLPVFTEINDVITYLQTGVRPQLPYNSNLDLDTFKVSYYLWSSTLTSPHYRFNVTWSNPDIYQVQVKIYSTRSSQSWESVNSPFSNTFQGSRFAQQNGDVIHCVATPYTSDGAYGNSLYYSFTFNGNDPLTNVWRKYNNTPYQNNIIDIPYTGVSGNEVVQAPVDGITQNYNYKVNYNPVTNEYGDLILNEIYYSPVVIYEDNTPAEVVEQTQTYITNNYTTNNYYDATNNIDYDYDFDFGDVSGSDIQNGYNGVGDFFNGFGTFIGKLANLLSGLFPFLSPAVATWLIAGVAFILALGVIMIFIKIVGAIKDVIPFL